MKLVAAWKIFTPILHHLEREKVKPLIYAFGSRGPPEADKLIEREGYERTVSSHARRSLALIGCVVTRGACRSAIAGSSRPRMMRKPPLLELSPLACDLLFVLYCACIRARRCAEVFVSLLHVCVRELVARQLFVILALQFKDNICQYCSMTSIVSVRTTTQARTSNMCTQCSTLAFDSPDRLFDSMHDLHSS